MFLPLALLLAAEPYERDDLLPDSELPEDDDEVPVPRRDDDAEEARRSRAMQLLALMREHFIASDTRRLWTTTAASADPRDEAAVRAALADPALLKLAPATVRAQLEGTDAAPPGAATEAAPPLVAAAAAPVSRAPPEPVFVGGLRLAAEGGLLQTTLPSGLAVVIVGDPVLRTTAIVHQVDSGAAADPAGKEGTAHLVEHLLFEGADPGGTFMARIDAEAGWANAWTTYDQTTYISSVLPASVREAIALEGQRFTRPLDTRPIEQERAVVADELRLRAGLEPGARLATALRQGLVQDHAYGRPIGGDEMSLSAITPADAEAYVEAHYGGANMRLVIVGPHDPREVLPLVEAAYAGLRSAPRGSPLPALARLDRGAAALEVPGFDAKFAGRAWRLPPAGSCLGRDDLQVCLGDYWAGQVSLALLKTGGASAMSDALMKQTLLATPVDLGHWQGAGGGYVYALAPRRPEGLIILQNVGSITLAVVTGALGILTILVGVWFPPVMIPLEHNPTPRMVDRVMADDEGEWITDAAIQHTRQAVLFDELARTWHAEARAMAIAEHLHLGMQADEAVSTLIGEVSADDVRTRLDAVLRRDNGVNVRVR